MKLIILYIVTEMVLRTAVYKFARANKPSFFHNSNLGTFYSSLQKISPVSISAHYIRNIKNKHTFGEKDIDKFVRENEFVANKKLISISPGGYRGFYMLGICKYIKQNYNLDDYIFSGASAGAWNSLLMCYKGDIETLQNKIITTDLQKINSIQDLEKMMKARVLDNYATSDFDLRRLFIGVTTIEQSNENSIYATFKKTGIQTNTTIFTGFDELEDALNCCIASSHIPLITGGFTNVYQNFLSYDGGFSNNPYLNITTSTLHITPNIWKKRRLNDELPKTVHGAGLSLSDYTTIFSKDKFLFQPMINEGYDETTANKDALDKILNQN